MLAMFGLARIGRDAELRYTPQGDAVCNLSLAFTLGVKGKDGKPITQWVDAALWGKRAEALAQYLVKGRAVSVSLQDPRIETYTTRDGTPSSKITARVADLAFAGPAQSDGAEAPAPDQPKQRAGNVYADAKAGRAPAATPARAAISTSFDDMDSDIPF